MNHHIFMLVNYTPLDMSIGITKKIEAEINAFRKLGCIVYYTAYIDNGVAVFDNNDKIIRKKMFFITNKKYQSIMRYFMLLKLAYSYLSIESVGFSIGYGRFSAPSNRYVKLLKLMKKKNMQVLIESLSYFPGMTLKSIKGKYIIWMLKKNRKQLPQCIDYFLTEGRYETLYEVPAKEIRIGVDMKNISPHNYCGGYDELNLISVANETMYHGYDRIIKSLAKYKKGGGKTKIKLHLVGVISKETKTLIRQLAISDMVILYGKKHGTELDLIYNKCNMGVGPLGQHRMGGKRDTGIKTKEYCAKGIPYFYSGIEIPELINYPYFHEVSNDERLVNIDELWDFYCTYKNDKNVVENMRKIAISIFSWENIMKDVLNIVNE
jgi:glycosyltransferase involved in cell wall biosynthesis